MGWEATGYREVLYRPSLRAEDDGQGCNQGVEDDIKMIKIFSGEEVPQEQELGEVVSMTDMMARVFSV